MKRVAVVDSLKYGSGTVSPERANQLHLYPLKMPTIDRSRVVGRLQEQQQVHRERQREGEETARLTRQTRARKRRSTKSAAKSKHHSAASHTTPGKFIGLTLTPTQVERYQQKGHELATLNGLLHQELSEQQHTELRQARTWQSCKEKGQHVNHKEWDTFCFQKIQKAPTEMKQLLLHSAGYHHVTVSSASMQKKKRRNDRAGKKLELFLQRRKEKREDDAWLSYARNCEPQLASQWCDYLEKHEKKYPVEGRTRILLEGGGGGGLDA